MKAYKLAIIPPNEAKKSETVYKIPICYIY